MITKAEAVNSGNTHFHHITDTQDRGRACYRVRRNGATQTWKTRPDEWRIPVKWGNYRYGQIWYFDAADWNIADSSDTCERCRPVKVNGPNGTFHAVVIGDHGNGITRVRVVHPLTVHRINAEVDVGTSTIER